MTAAPEPGKAAVRFDETAALYDICFVLNVNSRGWILEKICRVIERASGGICFHLFSERNDDLSYPLPAARHYFFAHFALGVTVTRKHPEVLAANSFVWFTHPDFSKGVTKEDIVRLAGACTAVFTPCSANRFMLAEWGAAPETISVPLGGADPASFRPKTRTGQGSIGFVGAYYERKQPARMLEIARLMPEQEILLVGPRPQDVENPLLAWPNWPGFAEFRALPNVRYVEAAYDEFPQWYQRLDVYCSTSLTEGGPIPAIEAMMSNVMPVISDTGFARDIVAHGSTGYIFDPAAPAAEIVALIRRALADTTTDVAAAAAAFSWDSFGQAIWRTMRGDVRLGQKVQLQDRGSAPRYLARGFHPPEARGVWTRAPVSELLVPVEPGARPSGLVLYLWAPAETAAEPLLVTFHLGDRQAAAAEVGPTPKAVPVPLGPADVDAAGCIRLSIRTSRLVSPADRAPGASEKRNLGVKIGWFELR
jgi:glycosyltransferase involved in cell wall biosynthesis